MNYDDYIPCQWPQCSQESRYKIHYEHESIDVCRAHREAVKINIESQNKIWIFKDQKNQPIIGKKGPIVRPGEQKPRYKDAPPPKVPAAQPDWRQEAAKRADNAAVPIDPAADIVQPRKRAPGDQRASQILGDSIKPD